MSLFVAVRPGEAALEDLQDALSRIRRSGRVDGTRWQPPSRWHLTLAFLGNPDDDVAAEVADRLATFTGHPRIEGLQLRGAGTFGGQVIWVGLAPGPPHDALAEIARALPPLMRGSGAVTDWRAWRAHLTVARTRRGAAGPLVDALAAYSGPMWDASELHLIQSTGGPRPVHQVIATATLD